MVDVAKVKNPIPENRPLFMKEFIKLLKLNEPLHLRVTLTKMAPEHLQIFYANYGKI